ncbi:MAG: GntR family transcriptional regulator [Microbacteriaceae bacterium]
MQKRVDGEAIYLTLRQEIQQGELGVEDYLKEVSVAERFGVSRTPAREALTRLVHERFLERTPRGLQLRQTSPQEIIQVYDVRITLEAEAAAQAAQNRNVTDLVKLEGLLQRDLALTGPDDDTRTRTNLEFHEAIWAATHNPVLIDLLDRLSVHLIHKPSSTLSIGERWAEALGEHAQILEAIQQRDATSARTIAETHMRTARELRLELFKQQVSA